MNISNETTQGVKQMANKFNLSNEVETILKNAGEKIGALQGEKPIRALPLDKTKFTCYFLYHTKAKKFIVAIGDDGDNCEYCIDGGSESEMFDTIEEAIAWWRKSFDGMCCSDMYYLRGHNMTKKGLKNMLDHDLDVPVMYYDGLNEALGYIAYEDEEIIQSFEDYLYDAMIDRENSDFCHDCIVVGRQARVEIMI